MQATLVRCQLVPGQGRAWLMVNLGRRCSRLNRLLCSVLEAEAASQFGVRTGLRSAQHSDLRAFYLQERH